MDEDLRQAVEQSQRRLASLSPERSLATARFAREAKPRLRTDRQREIAEEIAIRFEQRAAAHSSRSPG